jgi:hypothetical protein
VPVYVVPDSRVDIMFSQCRRFQWASMTAFRHVSVILFLYSPEAEEKCHLVDDSHRQSQSTQYMLGVRMDGDYVLIILVRCEQTRKGEEESDVTCDCGRMLYFLNAAFDSH